MDLELLIWVLVFVGGYSVILGYLLWVAMRRRPEDAPDGRPGDPAPPPR
jgi:hypothetical protein